MGRVENKVALITGAARGQGRAHAIRLAEEGADIIGIDICRQIPTVDYPMASSDDFAETALLVEKTGRKIVTVEADVRDPAALASAAAHGVEQLGGLDVVVCSAGIVVYDPASGPDAFMDVVNVNLTGVSNTVTAALPHLKDGSSVVLTGSVASLLPNGNGVAAAAGGGTAGYATSKRAIPGLVKDLAKLLAPRRIRVNGVYPTNCNTTMLQNPGLYKVFRPDVAEPTLEDALLTLPLFTMFGINWIEPEDVANTVVYLASDESRYVTGQQIAIDAGTLLQFDA